MPNLFKLLISAFIGAALCHMGGPAVFAQNGGSDRVTIQFPNTPITFILLEYEKLTSKRIVRDSQIESATLTIETGTPLTRDEAAEFIRKSLLLNGFVLIPAGPDSLKIVTEGKTPRSEGVPVITRAQDLPPGDQLVTYVTSVSHVSGEEVLQALITIAPPHSYGEVTVLPDGVSLAITDNTAVIRRYLELLAHIDVPTAEQITHAFPLLRSDAREVAEDLTELLGLGQSQGSSARAATPPAGKTNGNGARTNSGTSFRRPETKILALERTNKILVIAHPSQMDYIAGLIEEFDAAADTRNTMSRELHYLSVLDFLPVAQDALLRGADTEGAAQFEGQQTRRTAQSASFGSQSNSFGQSGFGGGSAGGSSGPRESLGEPEEMGGPQSLIVGHTLLIGDPAANELLVSGPPEHLDVIGRLLDQLDKKPRQIFLSTVIGQLTISDGMDLGVDLLQTIDGFNSGGDPVFTAGSYRTRSLADCDFGSQNAH